MASNPPPFIAEDTDEDFFDKLVNDDDDDYSYKPSTLSVNLEKNSSGSIVNDNDLEDVKALANLSITDSGTGLEDFGKLVIGEVAEEEVNSNLPNSFTFDSVNEINDNMPSIQLDSTAGSGVTTGIKQVQWSAFGSDSLDFFDEFGDDSNGKEEDNIVTSVVNNSLQVQSINNYSHQFQGEQENVNEYSQPDMSTGELQTDAQDPNSWENLYPGWRYDTNTAQWYQVDETSNVTSQHENTASDWTAANEKSEVSYMQQSSQAVALTASITNLNQVSQNSDINNNNNSKVYPSHMVFDPQYPDWYYDMNIQEWRSLDDYNSQSSVVAQEQFNQNGFVANYGNDQKTYGVQEDNNWKGSISHAEQHNSIMWQPNNVTNSEPMAESRNYQQVGHNFGTSFHVDHHVNQQQSYDFGSVTKAAEVNKEFPSVAGSQSFGSFSQPFIQPSEHSEMTNIHNSYGNQNQFSYMKQPVQNDHQVSYGSTAGRSSAGSPPHALVSFGFGGKLIVMKSTSLVNASYGGQDTSTGSISVHNLTEVVISGAPGHDYFHTLCQQPFPGPLSGGNAGAKELNRILDERITQSENSDADYNKVEVLRLLLSLLKIGAQHYGKLRSPFGSDTTLKENDAPEVAVARLFSSVKSSAENNGYGAFANCLQQVPSEGQTQETAAEVQTLLVSGRKKDALLRAQEGQLWGPALVLAAQLGDQFYVDTIRKMAVVQLVPGSPLRTLCLLIAGQPADVFAADATTDGGIPGAVNISHQPTQYKAQFSVNGMLDDWEDNLAVITANRTKDDELVLIHLGDCLWKERSNIIAAHICYLVAEANFEPYSDSARLCLIGADHWKHPRTYASPEAIQRTEVYEYSKMLGNSQFTLLPFQPYKLIYAHMLAEVGRVSDSLKYCQAVTKSLKTGRIPEVETWRQLVVSLEDRIKAHQLGGFSTNLAPAKIYGKLLNLLDSTAHRVVGLPPPVPSPSGGTTTQNDHHHQPPKAARVLTSQSTMTMSSLMPSASMEPINQVDVNNARMMHNRSASEPDFGRSPKQNQVDTLKENSADSQSKASGKTSSRLGRFGFGSGLFQKTVGMVLKPRQDKQAKLGDTNKFYYNEKLKRWVEEGVDPPAEEAALPPPPTMAAFQNGSPDYSLKTALRSESMSTGSSDFLSPTPSTHSPNIPPIPAATNQFSARGRTGVRARYVDTFNQGNVHPTNLFQSPSVPIKATPNPHFFVPKAEPEHKPVNNTPTLDTMQQNTTTSSGNQTPSFPSNGMQKFASMDDMSKGGTTTSTSTSTSTSSFTDHPMSRRTASWSGNANQDFSHSGSNGQKPLGSMAQYTFNETGFMHPSNDDLQEVEL